MVFIFFLTLFVFSYSVLETENVPRFRISRIRESVGELGAVIQEENKTSTLIVFRILRSSTANTTIPCHSSNSLHYFSGLFIVFSAPSQSSYSVWRHFDSLRAFAIKRVSLALPKASLNRTQSQPQLAFYEKPLASIYNFVYCFCRNFAFRFRTTDLIARITVNLTFHLRSYSTTNFINILTVT